MFQVDFATRVASVASKGLATCFSTLLVLCALVPQGIRAQSAPRVATSLPPAELAALDRIREAVWVHWFAGDTAALRRVLAPELVAMSSGGQHWRSLQETLDESAAFKHSGGTLVSVQFDSTMVHRFGETVVMFSHYTLVTQTEGKRNTQRGLATEVFVRTGGRWVHTSWQLGASE